MEKLLQIRRHWRNSGWNSGNAERDPEGLVGGGGEGWSVEKEYPYHRGISLVRERPRAQKNEFSAWNGM